MTRLEALKHAEELVDRLAPSKTDRGYPVTGGPTLDERVTAITDVADWLLPNEPDIVGLATFDGKVVRSISQPELPWDAS